MAKDTSNRLAPRSNGPMDDIAAVIGFTAALRLCAWYGDVNGRLYVPKEALPDHPLAILIGDAAMRALVQAWGGEHISVTRLEFYENDCRDRTVRDLLQKGLSPREISRLAFVGERRIQQLRGYLQETGMLELEKPQGKTMGKNTPENFQEKGP